MLGVGDTTDRTTPARVSTHNWATISAAGSTACGLYVDGTRLCWGDNAHGQLGIGDTLDRNAPRRLLSEGTIWSTVASFGFHSCGIRTDGSLWCWGDNFDGQLGAGHNSDRSAPVRVIA